VEWVETTAKTVAEAQEQALDQLGVHEDDAEIEVVESPKPGLFGRVRGNARVKARVRPTAPPPKQERRRKGGRGRDEGENGSSEAKDAGSKNSGSKAEEAKESGAAAAAASTSDAGDGGQKGSRGQGGGRGGSGKSGRGAGRDAGGAQGSSGAEKPDAEKKDRPMMPETEQREAGETFLRGLLEAFGAEATVSSDLDDEGVLSFDVAGDSLGLLIGPGLVTLDAVQEVCRNSIQRQADGREYGKVTLDVAGARADRTVALEAFVRAEAEKVLDDGEDVIFDVMSRADRKVVHDVVGEFDELSTESIGEDPRRRVVLRRA